MKIEFTPAVRRKTKARVALCGPSGSGKTYTALAFAHVFAPGSVALIDTEKESADGYEGLNGWHWVSFKPATYEPEVLVDALAAAAAAGIECVVIDSLSHFWMGTGGMLEQVDNSAKRSRTGNSFAGWKEMRPAERRMIEAMTSYPGHLIVTMRTKTEWVIQDNERGKKEPRRIGTKPEQREGIEYEFSVVADMDLDNVLTVSKTRVPPLKRAVFTEPGSDVAQTILDWLNDGGEAAPDVNAYRDRATDPYATREDLLALLTEVEDPKVGLAGATVVDDEGETGTLKDLIVRKGRALAPVAVAPEAPAAPAGEPAQPAAQSGTWYDDAIAKAAGFKSEAEGTKLWRDTAAAHRDGLCTRDEADHVQNLINARIEDRRKELSDAILDELPEADEWCLTVRELSNTADARGRLEEVEELSATGRIDVDRARLIGRAIIARFPKAALKKAEAA